MKFRVGLKKFGSFKMMKRKTHSKDSETEGLNKGEKAFLDKIKSARELKNKVEKFFELKERFSEENKIAMALDIFLSQDFKGINMKDDVMNIKLKDMFDSLKEEMHRQFEKNENGFFVKNFTNLFLSKEDYVERFEHKFKGWDEYFQEYQRLQEKRAGISLDEEKHENEIKSFNH